MKIDKSCLPLLMYLLLMFMAALFWAWRLTE